MKIPSRAQSIYAQLQMLEPTLRYIKDSLNDSEITDLEAYSDVSMACAYIKSAIVKIEHTSARKRFSDDDTTVHSASVYCAGNRREPE